MMHQLLRRLLALAPASRHHRAWASCGREIFAHRSTHLLCGGTVARAADDAGLRQQGRSRRAATKIFSLLRQKKKFASNEFDALWMFSLERRPVNLIRLSPISTASCLIGRLRVMVARERERQFLKTGKFISQLLGAAWFDSIMLRHKWNPTDCLTNGSVTTIYAVV